jgi:hypothetical protein
VHHDEDHPAVWPLLRQPAVRWFFAAVFFHILAHIFIYVFFSLYLDSLGYSKTVIGLLWALSVVIEIGWFFTQGRWLPRLSLSAWLVLAAALMALRMGLTAGFPLVWPVLLLAQALHAHLEARGAEGAVVNLLDQKLWNMNPDFFSYTLSKAALEAANTMLALALAPRVRVVGVAPGLTLTSHLLSEAKFAELHRQSPLGRSSTPDDVAATVAFALANRSITGTTLLVDGGQHLMRFERDFSLM